MSNVYLNLQVLNQLNVQGSKALSPASKRVGIERV